MRVSSDALTFNELLEEAKALQTNFQSQKDPIELGPRPAAVEKWEAALEARRDARESRYNFRMQMKDPDFSDMAMEAQMWLIQKNRLEERQDPFYFSDLESLLELETWKPREALLILVGIKPSAALVDWSYENFLGAEIQRPQIRRATWFADPSDLYDWPLPSDFDKSSSELKNDIRRARAKQQDDLVKDLETQLREVERWESDPTTCYLEEMLALRSDMLHHLSRRWFSADHDSEARHSPEYFVRWAEARGFEVEWVAWARQQGLIDIEAPATEAPYFDADSEHYPELLHIAVRAWDHARTASDKGTPKQRINDFVAERYPHVSEGAREAIALVSNWQKVGGRPKSRG